MEVVPYHPLLQVTADQVTRLRAFFDISDVKQINQSLDAVLEWAQKQDHLAEGAKYLSRPYLERVYILARGSVEQTKTKIDKLFTSRTLMPEICLHTSLKEFDKLFDCLHYIPVPKLHPVDLSRLMITQFVTDKLDDFSLLSYFRYSFLLGEYRLHNDYSIGDRFIIDLKNVRKLGILTKINPVLIKKSEILCSEAYGTKIKGIHILNAPPFVDKLVLILKQALNEKVASRLFVHNSYDDLHKHIPKEILPEDYDGDGPSVKKLNEQWRDQLATKEASRLIEQTDKLVSDESKRLSSTFNQEYLGMPGSFRSLTVD